MASLQRTKGPTPRARRRRAEDQKKGFIAGFLGFLSGLFRLILATTLFFAVLVVASYYVIGYFIKGQEIPAPDVKARSVTEALDIMKKWNLTLSMEREEPSDAVAQGEIIRQDPQPGAMIKSRSPIRVIVSSGPKHLPLPAELTAINRRETGIRLREMGLRVGNVAYVTVPGQANETVLALDPPVGTGVPPGSAVNLLVASDLPNRQTSVPDLYGLTLELAKAELQKCGLSLVEVKEEAANGVEPGTIHWQKPEAGTPITPGVEVHVGIAPTNPSP